MTITVVVPNLTSPFVANTPFQVIRRKQIDNDNGTTDYVETTFDAVGGVTSGAGNQVIRDQALTSGMSSLRVITSFRLEMPSKRVDGVYNGDIILFDGVHYTIKALSEYWQFGAGFCDADCVQTDFVAAATSM